MSRETRKQWLRHTALEYLATVVAPLSDLERLADGTRAMSSPSRHKIHSTVRKVEETAETLRSWPITRREKIERVASWWR